MRESPLFSMLFNIAQLSHFLQACLTLPAVIDVGRSILLGIISQYKPAVPG